MAASKLKLPRVVLGTMTFGPKGQTLEPTARDFLDRFKGEGFAALTGDAPELDTAIMYQGGEVRLARREMEASCSYSHPLEP